MVKPKEQKDVRDIISEELGYLGIVNLDKIDRPNLKASAKGLERLLTLRENAVEKMTKLTRMKEELPNLEQEYEQSGNYPIVVKIDAISELVHRLPPSILGVKEEQIWEIRAALEDILVAKHRPNELKARIEQAKKNLDGQVVPNLMEAEIKDAISKVFGYMGLEYDLDGQQPGKLLAFSHYDRLDDIGLYAELYLSYSVSKKSKIIVQNTVEDISVVKEHVALNHTCSEKEDAEANLIMDLCLVNGLELNNSTEKDAKRALFELQHTTKQILKDMVIRNEGIIGLYDKLPFNQSYVDRIIHVAKKVSRIDMSKLQEQSVSGYK